MKEIKNLIEIFEELNRESIDLVKELTKEEWEKETCLKGRSVKDLVTHLIDTSFRRVSMGRDSYFAESPSDFSHQGMIDFIQNLNRKWIEATKVLSPKILISLLELSNNELLNYLKSLDLKDKALFSVDWAGEKESLNEFDIAREYTEKWHHQMQIREAIGKEKKLYEKRFFEPIVLTFIKGAPYVFSKIDIESFTLEIKILGESGGSFYLEKDKNKVSFIDEIETENKILISQEEFWKLVTNSKEKDEVKFEIQGNEKLGNHILKFITVMS